MFGKTLIFTARPVMRNEFVSEGYIHLFDRMRGLRSVGCAGGVTPENVEPCVVPQTGIAGGFTRAEQRYQNRPSLRYLFLQRVLGLHENLGFATHPLGPANVR